MSGKPRPIAIGHRVHMLTAIETGLRVQPKPCEVPSYPLGAPAVRVQCDCGQTRVMRTWEFMRGRGRSCGCLRVGCRRGQTPGRHGLARHPLYQTWNAMLHRCYDPKVYDYPNYGGRGIEVHPDWRETPTAFIAYLEETLGERPDRHTLDRPNTDGNYEPGNLRWATHVEQTRNRRKRAA